MCRCLNDDNNMVYEKNLVEEASILDEEEKKLLKEEAELLEELKELQSKERGITGIYDKLVQNLNSTLVSEYDEEAKTLSTKEEILEKYGKYLEENKSKIKDYIDSHKEEEFIELLKNSNIKIEDGKGKTNVKRYQSIVVNLEKKVEVEDDPLASNDPQILEEDNMMKVDLDKAISEYKREKVFKLN